jgi:hypothetical protein
LTSVKFVALAEPAISGEWLMSNPHKASLLNSLQERFGELRKLPGSQSLFSVGDEAAVIYVRYSKVHPGGRTFFGLRQSDLRQLEGRNSFLCLLLNDESQPLFIPYADFEELFRWATPANDGQYKVQLHCETDGLELYIARQGRFNVEGYVGFEVLARSLDASRLRDLCQLSHSQVQTLLAAIGNLKGYDVWVPADNVMTLDWSLAKRFPLRSNIPEGFGPIKSILAEIDVIWIKGGQNAIEGLFEVEHSTSIYSGLLRFNDVLLTDPNQTRFSIVANCTRRAVFARQAFRPTFRKSGLAELVSFLEYPNVFDWHSRLAKGEG